MHPADVRGLAWGSLLGTLALSAVAYATAFPPQGSGSGAASGTDLSGLGTDDQLARWDGTDTLQGSSVTVLDTGAVSATGWLNVGSATAAAATGDFATGDGTRSILYDASNDLLAVGEFVNTSVVTVNESAARLFGSGTIQMVRYDAATTGVAGGFNLIRGTSGTPVAGFGTQMLSVLHDHTNTNTNVGSLEFEWETNPATAKTSQLRIGLAQAGAGSDGHTTAVFRGSDDTLRIEGGLEVGTSAGTITGAGDIAAGDGTRELAWDASTGVLQLTASAAAVQVGGANASAMGITSNSEELTGLSGASVSTTNLIPAGAQLHHVTVYVTTTITGATTFDIGLGADTDMAGAAIALTAGTTTTHADYTADPRGFWSASAGEVVLTANGSNFTGGAVRVVAFYTTVTAPGS